MLAFDRMLANSWLITLQSYPERKVHEANMGPTWVLSAPNGPHVSPMNLAISVPLIGGDEARDERVLSVGTADIAMA